MNVYVNSTPTRYTYNSSLYDISWTYGTTSKKWMCKLTLYLHAIPWTYEITSRNECVH